MTPEIPDHPAARGGRSPSARRAGGARERRDRATPARPRRRGRGRAVRAGPAALLLALAGCGDPPSVAADNTGPPASVERPPLVRVAPVELRAVRRFIETTSYLESEHRVPIYSEVAGRVRKVLVDDGEKVAKDAVLAELDAREAAAAVRQVEVQIEESKVRLQLMKLEVDAAKTRIEQARIERDKARAQHRRNLDIDPGLIAPTELEDSKYALESAEEALHVAEFEASKAALEVEAAQANIEELEARLEAERIRLEDHTIRSPIDGVIEACRVRGGEAVGTTTELFVVVDTENLVCRLRRPQREIAMLQDAREVTFDTDAFPGRTFRAVIDVIAPVVDQATGSFDVRMRVQRDDEHAALLRPGMFVRARILTSEQREALMVPKAAVVNEGARSVVFVVRDGIAARVVLETGIEERDHVECLNRGEGGLSDSDVVVTSGQHSLQDKIAVEIAPE